MKTRQKELLIIIPAFNEAENIPAVLDQLEQPEIVEIADILVMDDASLDNTRQIVQDRGHTVVSHIFHLGYGSGLQLGYKYAVKKGYQYVIQMDADGQHDACNVARLYEKLRTPDSEGHYPDIVLGSRFLEGSAPFPVSAVKKFAFRLFRTIIRIGTGRRIIDPTTGLQGLSRRAFQYYSMYSRFDDRYPDANMIMQMLLLGFRVEEIPAEMHVRTEGVSMHSGLNPMFYMFRMMFSLVAVWMRVRLYKVDVGVTNDKKAT